VIIPAIVRQVLRLPGLEAAGPVDRGGGPFPEHVPLRWAIESWRGRSSAEPDPQDLLLE
jgi:hypothetical protein